MMSQIFVFLRIIMAISAANLHQLNRSKSTNPHSFFDVLYYPQSSLLSRIWLDDSPKVRAPALSTSPTPE